MSAPLKIEPVDPIGTRRTLAFLNRGHADDGSSINHTCEEVEMAVYPDDAVIAGRETREIRVMLGWNLGETSRRLGISVVQLCDLERGRARCDRDEFLAAMAKEHNR